MPVLVLGSRDTLDALTSTLPTAPRPCIVVPPNGFGAPSSPVFSLPLLLFVQHCSGIVVVMARQARGDRSGNGNGNGNGIGKRPVLHAGTGDADGDGAVFPPPPPRDGIAESAADLRTVLRHLARRGFSSPGQMALLGGSHAGVSLGLAIVK